MKRCRKQWLSILLWMGLCLLLAHSRAVLGAPAILLTNVPAFGSLAELSGIVTDAAPAAYRVAVFIYVPSAGWWSKPYCDPQLTPIQPDGRWTADITTGGSDAYATRITALLVSTNYDQPCVLGLPVLPANVLTQAVASATVARADPTLRWVSFSGYDWWVKSSPELVGPGPNYFSDSADNVWVDAAGKLRLRITNRSNQWQCAEIVTARTFGYGSYRFELASVVNDLNINAVLGLFTWSDAPDYAHREIDIECSRWGNAWDVTSAQFVVQPWDWPDHLVRYSVPANLTNSSHLFVWETSRITFQSQRGSYSPNPVAANLISNWTYTSDVPQTGDENVRINLWLFNGYPPNNGKEVEFVVNSFQFVPLGSPLPATLTDVTRLANGQVRFLLKTQVDRRYQVHASTNLLDWQSLATLLATNSSIPFVDAGAAGSVRRFYRALTLP